MGGAAEGENLARDFLLVEVVVVDAERVAATFFVVACLLVVVGERARSGVVFRRERERDLAGAAL